MWAVPPLASAPSYLGGGSAPRELTTGRAGGTRHVYILIGGALGAACRFGLGTWIAPAAHFPFATGVINVSGCFGLGYLLPYTLEAGLDPDIRLGLTTGFFGAFTTFSTWELGVTTLWATSSPAAGWIYLAATLLLGLGAAAAGMALGRRTTSRG